MGKRKYGKSSRGRRNGKLKMPRISEEALTESKKDLGHGMYKIGENETHIEQSGVEETSDAPSVDVGDDNMILEGDYNLVGEKTGRGTASTDSRNVGMPYKCIKCGFASNRMGVFSAHRRNCTSDCKTPLSSNEVVVPATNTFEAASSSLFASLTPTRGSAVTEENHTNNDGFEKQGNRKHSADQDERRFSYSSSDEKVLPESENSGEESAVNSHDIESKSQGRRRLFDEGVQPLLTDVPDFETAESGIQQQDENALVNQCSTAFNHLPNGNIGVQETGEEDKPAIDFVGAFPSMNHDDMNVQDLQSRGEPCDEHTDEGQRKWPEETEEGLLHNDIRSGEECWNQVIVDSSIQTPTDESDEVQDKDDYRTYPEGVTAEQDENHGGNGLCGQFVQLESLQADEQAPLYDVPSGLDQLHEKVTRLLQHMREDREERRRFEELVKRLLCAIEDRLSFIYSLNVNAD